jgi:hypothetical protein
LTKQKNNVLFLTEQQFRSHFGSTESCKKPFKLATFGLFEQTQKSMRTIINWLAVVAIVFSCTVVWAQTPQPIPSVESTLSISILGTKLAFDASQTDITVAILVLDATKSAEDIRIAALPLSLVTVNMSPTVFTSCQLFDGGTAINTGGNIVNPVGGGVNWFTIDSGLIVPKGTTKLLTLRCDIGDASGWFGLGIPKSAGRPYAAGVESQEFPTFHFGNRWGGWSRVAKK